jgi:tight adherence protein B
MEPQDMGRLFSDYIGWAVCAVIALLLAVGFYFIKKIVTIDI